MYIIYCIALYIPSYYTLMKAKRSGRRASAKFAGRQKVHMSNKFGFTKYTKKERFGGLALRKALP